MSIAYGWFLGVELGKERVLEFVRTVPNEGITELLDGKLFDVYRKGTEVVMEEADLPAEILAEAKRRLRGGSISYELGAELELARCILVEGCGTTRSVFEGHRCHDLAAKLGSVQSLLEDASGPRSEVLQDLEAMLSRALDLHIVVRFGE